MRKMIWQFPIPRTHCGVPLGNGMLGALVWGRAGNLHITVSRSDSWDHRGGQRLEEGETYRRLQAAYDPADPAKLQAVFHPREWKKGRYFTATRLPGGRFDFHLAPDFRLTEARLDPRTGRLTVLFGIEYVNMDTNDGGLLSKYCAVCGGTAWAIENLATLSSTLWNLSMPLCPNASVSDTVSNMDAFQLDDVLKSIEPPFRENLPQTLELLVAKQCCTVESGILHMSRETYHNPCTLPRIIFANILPEHDIRYFAVRSIRRRHHCIRQASTMHAFHLFCDALNWLLASRRKQGGKETRIFKEVFLPPLLAVAEKNADDTTSSQSILSLFLECCRIVGYISVSRSDNRITLGSTFFEPEFLLCHLFSIPSGMPGFDEVFGGGGIILGEDLGGRSASSPDGRVVLIKGKYGTGKTLLSMHIASNVAQKGGIAWITTFEQPPEDYLYLFESFALLPQRDSVLVATDAKAAARLIKPDESRTQGAIAVLDGGLKGSFDDFLAATKFEALQLGSAYPLRLVIADPINSVQRDTGSGIAILRGQLQETLNTIKRACINILLVSEENTDPDNQSWFEENIADTVIHLQTRKDFGYSRRYFEVTKSRLQRVHRGHHSFSITAGSGINISPAPPAVYARIQARHVIPPTENVKYGLYVASAFWTISADPNVHFVTGLGLS